MPSWTLTETHPTQGRVFQRPVYPTELHLTDESKNTKKKRTNLSYSVNAWLSTKRRHPLVGATVQVLPGNGDAAPTVHFVVREHDLAVLRPHEIFFGHVTCAEEVPQKMAAIRDGSRPLSDDLLVQLYVFRETDPKRQDVLHLMVLIAHSVSDRAANRMLMRCLLDTLARGRESSTELPQIPLEDRLATVVPPEDLEPAHLRSLSPTIRRWRQAVGAVIFQLRMAKCQGGHTLPCRRTRMTPYTPSRSGFASTLLTQAQTTTVLANCRRYGVTLGNAFPVLAQVAMTRVLYRRYLRGEMSEEEWEYRKRQPYLTFGPTNLRPHLDTSWYEMGGAGEFVASVSATYNRLPFMTLGETEREQYDKQRLSHGAPPFSDLLTFDRFLHRAGMVKKQGKTYITHPLFFEMLRATSLELGRIALRRVQLKHMTTKDDDDVKVLAVTDMPLVIAHTACNLGNVELLLPNEYPLPPSHPLSPFSSVRYPGRAGYVAPPPTMEVDTTPRIVVENALILRYHTRPEQLYLGMLGAHGRLNLYVFYDSNVYDEEVVREWLDEVNGAVLSYLC